VLEGHPALDAASLLAPATNDPQSGASQSSGAAVRRLKTPLLALVAKARRRSTSP
jgi:hypothetical protein